MRALWLSALVSTLCFKRELWVNYISMVHHLSPSLHSPHLLFSSLSTYPRIFLYMPPSLLSSCPTLLSLTVAISPRLVPVITLVKTRDLICWNYLRTYDERQRDGWKKMTATETGIWDRWCPLSILFKGMKVHIGMAGLSNKAKNGAKHFPPVRKNDTTSPLCNTKKQKNILRQEKGIVSLGNNGELA